MKKALFLSFVSIMLISTSVSFAEENENACLYKVKEGDWIAKILRDLGSKDPFADKSYFETVKLNQEKNNINKLSKGDVIKIPKRFVTLKNASDFCINSFKKTVVKKEETKSRVPASIKSKAEPDPDPFPVLEYKAAVPRGGAK